MTEKKKDERKSELEKVAERTSASLTRALEIVNASREKKLTFALTPTAIWHATEADLSRERVFTGLCGAVSVAARSTDSVAIATSEAMCGKCGSILKERSEKDAEGK